VEEVILLLEDMSLNLQSMMASPYVRPFAEDVRKWEQRLSLIGESTEVCMLLLHNDSAIDYWLCYECPSQCLYAASMLSYLKDRKAMAGLPNVHKRACSSQIAVFVLGLLS
jgi:hypothetical protein